MIDAAYLTELLRKAHADEPWHGPSVADTLRDLTAAQAAARPIPGAHSIWELVLHLAAWQGEVTRRLQGNAPAMPDEGDWPAVGVVSEAAWQSALEHLDATFGRLLETLGGLTDADLDRSGGSLDRALGTGAQLRTMAVGLLQHAAYHSGQVVMLRKALAG
ncbi:MAG TPA: DinB family protein [Thermoanaerobaculia bacterium]|jgi:uncharacterized damage-inducible protein DinB|nr:DinB family protein [Thermoanaerobaculia bacterium]